VNAVTREPRNLARRHFAWTCTLTSVLNIKVIGFKSRGFCVSVCMILRLPQTVLGLEQGLTIVFNLDPFPEFLPKC